MLYSKTHAKLNFYFYCLHHWLANLHTAYPRVLDTSYNVLSTSVLQSILHTLKNFKNLIWIIVVNLLIPHKDVNVIKVAVILWRFKKKIMKVRLYFYKNITVVWNLIKRTIGWSLHVSFSWNLVVAFSVYLMTCG